MKLQGIGASSGVAIAKAFVFEETKITIDRTPISNQKQAISAIQKAIKKTIKEIKAIKQTATSRLSNTELAIFDAHISLALDPSLQEKIVNEIETNALNAIAATSDAIDFFANTFAKMNDPYMQERAADVRDVGKRILRILAGAKNKDLSTISEEVIIVADDLTPSETAVLNKKYVKGFVTNIGGKTSHAAIMARSLQIPAVVGLKIVTDKVQHSSLIALDGDQGVVIVNPSKTNQNQFIEKANQLAQQKKLNAAFYGQKSLTKDGKIVELAANIGSLSDLDTIHRNDAEGVGLFRSEFLYMSGNQWPSEEHQFQVYKKVLSSLKGKLVVVRTLDIGGDKTLNYYKFPPEMNPFLGYRAIRLCLDQEAIFRTQIRALLRASIYGKLAIMFPMIATVEEFLQAKAILEDCKQKLKAKNIAVANDIAVGMMMEIPAAAVLARQFAVHADFFSIGTNDLMQYTMAADRMNEQVSYLYQPLNPAILKLIKMIIEGAHYHQKWVGMCGEMASDSKAIPLLIGLGLDEFSMTASLILKARRLISQVDSKKAKAVAKKALLLDTELEVAKLVATSFE